MVDKSSKVILPRLQIEQIVTQTLLEHDDIQGKKVYS